MISYTNNIETIYTRKGEKMFRKREKKGEIKNKVFELAIEMNVDRSEDETEKKLEDRANILYDHPDNDRGNNRKVNNIQEQRRNIEKKKREERIERVDGIQNVNYLDTINSSTAKANEIKFDKSEDEIDYFNRMKQGAKEVIGNIKKNYGLGAIIEKELKNINSDEEKRVKMVKIFNNLIVEDQKLLRSILTRIFGIEAAENLFMAYSYQHLNTPYARQYKVYKNFEQIEDPYLRNYMLTKLIKEVELGKINRIRGIYIDENSFSSRELANSADIRKILSANNVKEDLLKGKIVDNSIRFTDKNFKNALGKADIVKARLLPSGEIDLYVCDYYNFNRNEKEFYIEAPRNLEEKGYLVPYFIIYHVVIPSYTSQYILGKNRL